MFFKLSLASAIFLTSSLPSCAQSWPWKSIQTGRYPIGYKTIRVIDSSRPYSISPRVPRIFPLHIWYPALRSNARKMRFIDYVQSDQNPTWGEHTAMDVLLDNLRQYGDSARAQEVGSKLADVRTASEKKATAAPGRFPVVLFGNGLNTPGFFYTLMAEYLASHGYVVVEFPSLPENSSSLHSGFDERSILNQLADTEAALGQIAGFSFVDTGKLALVSWSLGGVVQILFQMKNRSVKALVSLDGASQYEYGNDLLKTSVYYDGERFGVPFLNLTGAGSSGAAVPRSRFFYDSLACNKQAFVFEKLTHPDFTSFKQYIRWLDRPDEELQASYEKMCEITRLFVDAVVLDDP
jgi:hypothetical protein